MANTAHCAYCYESLSADLEGRSSLSFLRVQDLWTEYEFLTNGKATARGQDTDSTAVQDQDISDDDDNSMNGLDGEEDGEGVVQQRQPAPDNQSCTRSNLQLPSISRLQAPSPASASSLSSTPSSLSTASSNVALGGDSKSSSNSSFFSFGRSKQPSPAPPRLEEHHPLFVTWNIVSPRSRNKSLRGCIGTFDAQELSSGLSSYALTAAFNDTRFAPISHSELRNLSCSVTLLTNFTPCDHATDWELGTHGIRISFTHNNKRYGATYLPDVASEQGWTKEETLVSLMRKGGWVGKSRDWRDVFGKGKGSVVRYEGAKASLDFAEWAEWREWASSLGAR